MKGEVSVTLDDFDSDDILDAAVDIIGFHLKQEVPKDSWQLKRHKMMDEYVTKLRAILRAEVERPDDQSLPPPSTAAKIKTPEQLREYVQKVWP